MPTERCATVPRRFCNHLPASLHGWAENPVELCPAIGRLAKLEKGRLGPRSAGAPDRPGRPSRRPSSVRSPLHVSRPLRGPWDRPRLRAQTKRRPFFALRRVADEDLGRAPSDAGSPSCAVDPYPTSHSCQPVLVVSSGVETPPPWMFVPAHRATGWPVASARTFDKGSAAALLNP